MAKSPRLYVRPYSEGDTQAILKIGRQALKSNPLVTYVCAGDEAACDVYLSLLLTWALSMGGKIDVVCAACKDDGEEKEGEGDPVVGAAVWCLARHRLSYLQLLKSFSLKLLVEMPFRLGMKATARLLYKYPQRRMGSLDMVSQSDPSLRRRVDEAWSVELLVIEDGFQDRGLKYMLIQRHKTRSEAPILLEVASVSEMNCFRNLGFELFDRFQLDRDSEEGDERLDVFSLIQVE